MAHIAEREFNDAMTNEDKMIELIAQSARNAAKHFYREHQSSIRSLTQYPLCVFYPPSTISSNSDEYFEELFCMMLDMDLPRYDSKMFIQKTKRMYEKEKDVGM